MDKKINKKKKEEEPKEDISLVTKYDVLNLLTDYTLFRFPKGERTYNNGQGFDNPRCFLKVIFRNDKDNVNYIITSNVTDESPKSRKFNPLIGKYFYYDSEEYSPFYTIDIHCYAIVCDINELLLSDNETTETNGVEICHVICKKSAYDIKNGLLGFMELESSIFNGNIDNVFGKLDKTTLHKTINGHKVHTDLEEQLLIAIASAVHCYGNPSITPPFFNEFRKGIFHVGKTNFPATFTKYFYQLLIGVRIRMNAVNYVMDNTAPDGTVYSIDLDDDSSDPMKDYAIKSMRNYCLWVDSFTSTIIPRIQPIKIKDGYACEYPTSVRWESHSENTFFGLNDPRTISMFTTSDKVYITDKPTDNVVLDGVFSSKYSIDYMSQEDAESVSTYYYIKKTVNDTRLGNTDTATLEHNNTRSRRTSISTSTVGIEGINSDETINSIFVKLMYNIPPSKKTDVDVPVTEEYTNVPQRALIELNAFLADKKQYDKEGIKIYKNTDTGDIVSLDFDIVCDMFRNIIYDPYMIIEEGDEDQGNGESKEE